MYGLRFAVLGPVRAWRGGTELELGTPQQRAVLAVLLLRRGRMVPADDLIDALWGDEPPTTAMTALRTYASRLRTVLEPERAAPQTWTVMVTEAGGYALRVPKEALDLGAVEEKVAEADQARRAGDLATAAEALRTALAAWDGEPLAGIRGAWADAQRVHLREQRLGAQESARPPRPPRCSWRRARRASAWPCRTPASCSTSPTPHRRARPPTSSWPPRRSCACAPSSRRSWPSTPASRSRGSTRTPTATL